MTSGRQRIGFLGPLGTFTEQALLTQPDLAAAEHVLFRTMPDVLERPVWIVAAALFEPCCPVTA